MKRRLQFLVMPFILHPENGAEEQVFRGDCLARMISRAALREKVGFNVDVGRQLSVEIRVSL